MRLSTARVRAQLDELALLFHSTDRQDNDTRYRGAAMQVTMYEAERR